MRDGINGRLNDFNKKIFALLSIYIYTTVRQQPQAV